MSANSAKIADSFEKLYSALPKDLKTPPSNSSDQTNNEQLKDFLKSKLPGSDQKEIDGELRKTFNFHSQPGKKIKMAQPRKKKGKYLTAYEKKKLGLNKLPKVGLKFSDFHELHSMWQDYMCEVLNLEHYLARNLSSEGNTLLDDQLQMRVCRADFHGAFVKVTKAKAGSQVGLEGYVVMETRNTFQLVTKKDRLKIIIIHNFSL